MKVLLFTGSSNIGGTERQLCMLAGGLRRRGVEVEYVTIVPDDGGADGQIHVEHTRALLTSVPRGRYEWARAMMSLPSLLRKVVAEFNPNIVMGVLTPCHWISWLATRGLGNVALMWGVRSSYLPYGMAFKAMRSVNAVMSHNVDCIAYNSKVSMQYYRRLGFRPRLAAVVDNGIDVDYFKHDGGKRSHVRSEFGVAGGEVLIGNVSRMTPVKGHDVLLKAWSMLDRKNVRFLCCGGGDDGYRDKMIRYAEELGISNKIIWIKSWQDMPALYSAMDMFVLSSLGEGFPNVVAEAMSCGVPCVVTDVGEASVIVGKYGKVVSPGSAEELSAAIDDMLDNLEDVDGDVLRRSIVERYSSEKMVDAYMALFRQVLGQ